MLRRSVPSLFAKRTVFRLCDPAKSQPAAAAAAAAAGAAQAETAATGAAADAGEESPKRSFSIGGSGRKQKIKVKQSQDNRWDGAFKERGTFFAGFTSIGIISLGLSFLFVPIFRLYCTPSGRGFDSKFYTPENVELQKEKDAIATAFPTKKKLIKIRFLADIGNTMPIAFVPLQKEVEMLIGEPGLAFYSAYNKTQKTLLGVSSYTISPPEATNYLNKIQCFCFEEQRFKPHELVEMPVFFYIDKDFLNDPLINWLDELIVNYTFFNLERTKDHVLNN